ncbi:MAG: ABC transporter ATP-binding protein, partial [Propioniciclava sp.]
DEPTSGLDPLMEAAFREEVAKIKQRGATVLLSSHILSEVEALADTISIIRDGAIVESGTLTQMRHLRRTLIEANTNRPVEGLPHLAGVYEIVQDGNQLTLEVDGDAVGDVLAALADAGVTSLIAQPPTLEQMLLRHYQTQGR